MMMYGLLLGPLVLSLLGALQAVPVHEPDPSVHAAPRDTGWSDVPLQVQQSILGQLSAREGARARSVAQAWRPDTPNALLPATVAELHGRGHPLLSHENPYLLYRFCLTEQEQWVRHIPTLERCLADVDRSLPSARSTLAQVRVQVLYDVLSGATEPPLPRTRQVLQLLLRGATTALWTPEQRRAVLFAAVRHGQDVYLQPYTFDHDHRTMMEEVMVSLCPASGTQDQVAKRDCLAARSMLMRDSPATLLAPQTAADDRALTSFRAAQHQLCEMMASAHPTLAQLVDLVQRQGANIHTDCGLPAVRQGPIIHSLLHLDRTATAADPASTTTTTMEQRVNTLVSLGADVNERHPDGQLVFLAGQANAGLLVRAAAEDRLALLRSLLAHGADPGAKSERAVRFVTVASQRGLVQDLTLLFQHGMRPAQFLHPYDLLSMVGSRDVVQLLVRYGVDWKEPSPDGQTALHLAARYGNLEAVAGLVAAGADPLLPDPAGNTPLHVATVQSLPLLLQDMRPEDMNPRNGQGETPVHLARTRGRLEELLEFGADPNVLDARGETPLYRAVVMDVAKLREAPGQPDRFLWFPLLLEHGALVDGPGGRGRSALLPAVQAGNLRIVEHLLRHQPGANLNARDERGRTLSEVTNNIAIRWCLAGHALSGVERGGSSGAGGVTTKAGGHRGGNEGEDGISASILNRRPSPDSTESSDSMGSVDFFFP